MSIFKKYEELISQRKKMEGDIDYERDSVILETIELMTKDVEETIAFLDKDCTEEQFIWLSEVFDEIAQRTGSKALIDALMRVSKKYPEATEKYNINYFINSAAEYTD